MILFWLVFDVWGAMKGGGGVAYFAHLGGFAGGVALAILMLKLKMVTMERYEKSLLQIIEEYRHPSPFDTEGYYDYLRTSETAAEMPLVPFELKTISTFSFEQPQTISLEPQSHRQTSGSYDDLSLRLTCGKRSPAKFAGKR
jgi:hypothetical protein